MLCHELLVLFGSVWRNANGCEEGGKGSRGLKKKPFLRQLARVRKICLLLPDTTERISHGEPTFFSKKGVFTMFSNNHHQDGHVAVWVPAPPGLQEELIAEAPGTYYRPPYVGSGGWIGIELDQIGDEALAAHIRQGWNLIAKRK